MRKYCILQLKRVAKYLPWALCVVLVLFGCMSLVFTGLMNLPQDEENSKIRIGIVGSSDNSYIQWGLAAMQFDSTAMSLTMELMEQEAATRALERGEIAAYVVFPEEFIEDAIAGNVGQLQLVSTVGATGLVPLFKEEVTELVEKILSACENGSYGAGDAVADNGMPEQYYQHLNDLSLEYMDFLLHRSRMYRVENVAQNRLSMQQYMLGGLSVLLLMLCCLPFAPLYIRHDHSLSRVLRTRRVGPVRQTLAEFAAYVAALLVLLTVMVLVLRWGDMLPIFVSVFRVLLGALPTLLMVASLTYCLYTLSDHLIGGILLSFFCVLVLGFVGGCMYPVQVFPLRMQRLAAILPTGLARQSLTACFLESQTAGVLPLLGYSAAFLLIAMGLRGHKTGKVWR